MPKSVSTPFFVLITGCSSGIGREFALQFAAAGATVLATARRPEVLQGLCVQHPNIEPFFLELEDQQSMVRLRDAVAKRTNGRLDILINNAGMLYDAACLDADIAQVQKVFSVNFFAVMRMCQLFTPLLREAPHGKIVQIGSICRDLGIPFQTAYNASKAALSSYCKNLRVELMPLGIEVVELVSACVKSDIFRPEDNYPDDTLYGPVKATGESIRGDMIRYGEDTDVYVKKMISHLLRPSTKGEIWGGKYGFFYRLGIWLLPLPVWNWLFYVNFKLGLVRPTGGQ